MKTTKASLLALASLATLASFASTAQAENVSLRLGYSETGGAIRFEALRAETGGFAVTPSLPDHAGGQTLRVVAKDAKGNIVHETAMRNGLRLHVESFNPATGKIEHAETVRPKSAVMEVSMPYGPNIASIEVLPHSDGKQAAGFAPAALAKFGRGAIGQLLAAARSAPSLAATATATTIINNGSAAAKMDYVFVGDGYTAAEMAKWKTDAQKVIDGFMADPLFAANRASMNVRRVDVASNQSGVDETDLGIYKDTAMDGEFNCYNMARLLCVNNTKVLNIVGSVLAPDARDVIIVVSNSTRYGGSGGDVATLSMHASATEVALHEIGHTAFKLADEYDYGTCDRSREPSEGNVSLNGTRSVKWGDLISASTAVPTSAGSYANGTVGAFAGARYCTSGMYRPTENSRMRTLGYPWHAVNERLVKAVFSKYGGTTTGSGVTQTGTLAAGATVKVPNASPNYVQAGAGTFSMSLTGPTGSNFDLALYRWNGSTWTKVASSAGTTSTESINYSGTAGYYYGEVKATSGSGAYTVKYSFPK